jgi:hypothetical protein
MGQFQLNHKQVGKATIVEITLPNGDNYRLACSESCIDVNSNSNWDGKDLIIRPRVSNEIRIQAIGID